MDLDDKNQLRSLAQVYVQATGKSLTATGREAAKDGSFFPRLAEMGLTIRKRDDVLRWFSRNWPEGTPWPEGIPRPTDSPPTSPVGDENSNSKTSEAA